MSTHGRRGAVLVTAALLAASSPAVAQVERGAGTTTLVSVADDGAQANGKSDGPDVSADARFVVFVSKATNLVPGDANDEEDVFVRDRTTGTTAMVSVSSNGEQGNRSSSWPSISSDGRFVAFSSRSAGLVPGDTNREIDIFVRDLQEGTTERVSVGDDETQIEDDSTGPAISGDGRYVVFSSGEGALVRDRLAGTTVAVPGAGAISEHGRFLAFTTYDRLTRGDRDPDMDLYVLDRRTGTNRLASRRGFYIGDVSMSGDGRMIAYVASPRSPRLVRGQVFVTDLRARTTELASVSSRGVRGDAWSDDPVLSRDGRSVVFWSAAHNLAPHTGQRHLAYAHDLRTGATRAVSVGASGALPDRRGGSAFGPGLAVSANGRTVAFVSRATNLVRDDTNGWPDVFVRDRGARPSSQLSRATN